MSYRYDKQKKNRRFYYGLGSLFLILALFTPVYGFLFNVFQKPIMQSWENKQDLFADTSNIFQSFGSKQKILEENKKLQQEIDRLKIDNLRTRYLADQLENTLLVGQTDSIIGSIIEYGSLAAYDNVVVNKGIHAGVTVGDKVFIAENVLIGYVADTYSKTSRVALYSDNEQSISGILYPHNETLVAQGNGGGNFIIETPREINVENGDIFYSLGEPGNIIGIVRHVEFDPRDPFKQVYLSYPINLKDHQIVGIKKTLTQSE